MKTFSELIASVRGERHLLLGNGFSIACDPVFRYANLFEAAKKNGLSDEAQKVFGLLGTNNFEGVLRLLDHAAQVGSIYGLKTTGVVIGAIKADIELIKKTLVEAVAKNHLASPSDISADRLQRCLAFLSSFTHVFTTNYDLLPYWVTMEGLGQQIESGDGFRASEEDPEAPHLVFSEHIGGGKGLFFIHGALHLYLGGGETRKHSWKRSGKKIVELVVEGLEKKQYPLFVAEGDAERKLDQINRSGYLSYCLGKLGRIQSPLIVYGHSFGESDKHIVDCLLHAVKLERLFVGIHGGKNTKENKKLVSVAEDLVERRIKMMQKRKGIKELKIEFFDSSSAPVWDEKNISTSK